MFQTQKQQKTRKLSIRKEAAEIDRLRRGFERKLESRLKRFFVKALRDIAKDVANETRDVDLRKISLPLEQILLPHYREVITTFSKRVLTRLEIKDEFDAIVRRYINERGGRNIVNISAFTKEQVNKTISEEIAKGSGYRGAAKAVEQLGPDFSRRRSAVIARTETHNASGFAHHEMHKEYMPPNTTKKWVATTDSRTRSIHASANGQTVGIDENFIVGGRPMRYAGDYRGGPENVINCRCTIVYIAPEDDLTDDVSEVPMYSDQPWVFREGIKPKFDLGNMQLRTTFGLGLRSARPTKDELDTAMFGAGEGWDDTNPSVLGLGERDAAPIFWYTTSKYAEINNFYRSWFMGKQSVTTPSGYDLNIPINDTTKAEALGFRQEVKRVFENLPAFKGQVHRGVSNRVEAVMGDLGIDKVGSIVRAEGFWSTSFEQGKEFKKKLSFVIESKTGRQIDAVSNYDYEKEVLFLPASEFRVTRIQKTETGKTIVYMEELGDELKQEETKRPVLIDSGGAISYSRRFLAKMYSQEEMISVNGRLIDLSQGFMIPKGNSLRIAKK